MLLLINNRHALTERLHQEEPHRFGALLQPQSNKTGDRFVKNNIKWALDNGCYNGLNETAFLKMLERNAPIGQFVMWCVVPDYFSGSSEDAFRTAELYNKWQPIVSSYGYKCAYVAQVGQELFTPNWNNIDCLFIGGTTEWKLSEHAFNLLNGAKALGKATHMGRVNSAKRVRKCLSWNNVDSVDGLTFAKFWKTNLPRILPEFDKPLQLQLC